MSETKKEEKKKEEKKKEEKKEKGLGKLKPKKLSWPSILSALIAVIGILFGLSSTYKAVQEERRRIEAQNELARQSEVIQESNTRWMKLSQQVRNINAVMEESNSELLRHLSDTDQHILVLSEIVANIKPTRIVVREENVTETPVNNGERIRVDFEEEVDPMRVEGFTLTNPAEAELEVSFTRPLGLRTVVTQREDGSWITHFESDWENLSIEEIDTVVNPFVRSDRESIRDNFIIGFSISASRLDTFHNSAHVLYEFKSGRFSMGPNFGISSVNGNSRISGGFIFQWRPGRR